MWQRLAHAVPAGDPAILLRMTLTRADEHLFDYGHDMTWLAGRGRFDGICKGCRGRAVVHMDGRGMPRVTVGHGGGLAAPGCGDYAECSSILRGQQRPGLAACTPRAGRRSG
jgi:hypothetical protein